MNLVKEAKKSSFKKSILMGQIDETVNKWAAQIPKINLEKFVQGDLVMRVVMLGSIAEITGNSKAAAACIEFMEIINA